MKKTILVLLLFSVCGALILMMYAFINGFPLVYSDTSTYLASGFELQTPVDRPIAYGVFLKILSLNGLTLWLPVFFQALLFSFLLLLLLKQIIGEKLMLKYGLAIIILLVLFTGISWTVSELIADVFTPIALLSLLLIIAGNQSKVTTIFLYFVYFISMCMHLSHFIIFSILLLIILLLKRWITDKDQTKLFYRKWVVLFVLTVGSILTMGSAISKSKDVFLIGALVEQGIAKQYLDEHCSSKHYKMCAYKDSLPKTFNGFVWDTNSAFYKTGGWSAENRKEYDEIIMNTYTEPKYILLHLKASCKATLHQLLSFQIADGNGAFNKGTLLCSRVLKYCKNDSAAYCNSKQNLGYFTDKNRFINTMNIVDDIVGGVSAGLLILLFAFYYKRLDLKLRALIVVILFSIIVSAWDAGTFSTVADRFGCKMMWLLTLVVVIVIIQKLNSIFPPQSYPPL